MCFSVFVFYWTEKGKKSGHNQNRNLQRPGFVFGLNVPWISLCSSIISVAGIKCLIKDNLWRMVLLGSQSRFQPITEGHERRSLRQLFTSCL